MTLKKYIENSTQELIMEALIDMYPECLAQSEAYEDVIDYVVNTPESNFDGFVIEVGLIDPSTDGEYEEGVDEEAYLSISGYSVKEDLHFALGFSKWEEWANAKIIIQEDLMISPEELVAICIYEMTFYGFDQESILRELVDLEKGITNEMYH